MNFGLELSVERDEGGLMSHPFEVGKRYRNRLGEYVVQTIDGIHMTIRYEDGRTLDTKVDIQARIWENIQFEKQMAMAEERRRLAAEERKAARQRAARARRERAKPTFDGFEASDFEPKTRGIAWHSRKELGRVLAYELSRRLEGTFGYWIVPRRSKLHVALREAYETEERETNAAFLMAAAEEGLSYGFTVGKPKGRSKAAWPWRILMANLEKNDSVRKALYEAMAKNDLQIDVWAMEKSYGQVARITAEGKGFLWQHEDEEQEVSQKMNGEELAEYLKSVTPTKRCELHVRKRIPPKNAVAAGSEVSDEILTVIESLMPIYDASVTK
jgi:hypothetical protein